MEFTHGLLKANKLSTWEDLAHGFDFGFKTFLRSELEQKLGVLSSSDFINQSNDNGYLEIADDDWKEAIADVKIAEYSISEIGDYDFESGGYIEELESFKINMLKQYIAKLCFTKAMSVYHHKSELEDRKIFAKIIFSNNDKDVVSVLFINGEYIKFLLDVYHDILKYEKKGDK